jgi:hypothetical protein
MMSACHARSVTLLALLLGLVLLPSCYRVTGVRPLGEAIRVVVSVNEARLVRVQGYLQQEVAAMLEDKLGWRVSPTGSAKLELFVDQEEISASGRDTRGIASRWTIRCSGQALLTARRGNLQMEWNGTGYSSGLADEAEAIRLAARNAAGLIATWLENEAERWPADAPEP